MVGHSQCDKKIRITSTKTEYLDAAGNVQRTKEENTIIEFDNTGISISPDGQIMKGTVKFESCKWTKPFKEGKSVMAVTINEEGGTSKTGRITIEGKEGKVYFILQPDDNPDKIIRVLIENFEEKK
jgi:hypothetical protein